MIFYDGFGFAIKIFIIEVDISSSVQFYLVFIHCKLVTVLGLVVFLSIDL